MSRTIASGRVSVALRRASAPSTAVDTSNPDSRRPRSREDSTSGAALAAQQAGRDLTVDYILATDPGTRHRGTVKEIHEQASAVADTLRCRLENGNVVTPTGFKDAWAKLTEAGASVEIK